jgi:uncharacterized protein
MRIRCAFLLLIFIAVTLASHAFAAELKFPALSGRVVDDANVLSTSTQAELTEMLAAHERATGEQVVVVTLASLQGNTIEDYGYQLGRHWGIGQKDKNTGAILIVAPKEHKVRIEVGYGLEGKLTDALSRTIIESDIVPSFKRGDFNGGVVAGTTSILKVLGGESVQTSAETSAPSQGSDHTGNFIILLAMAVWMIMVFILNRIQSRHQIFRRMGRSFGSGWGSSGGGFSSGGNGGGFSGGGGSFGGGGASGSW